jgi:hypothetical protein
MENSNYSDWKQATLDTEGYAVCPDCGSSIHCGTVGLPNLEKRHRGIVYLLNRCRQSGFASLRGVWASAGEADPEVMSYFQIRTRA